MESLVLEKRCLTITLCPPPWQRMSCPFLSSSAHCLCPFVFPQAKPVSLHIQCCCDASILFSWCCLLYHSIHPSPILTPPPLHSFLGSFFFLFLLLLPQSFWPIKLQEEWGEQAGFSGLATPLWVHWLALILFVPGLCWLEALKEAAVACFKTANKKPPFIRVVLAQPLTAWH